MILRSSITLFLFAIAVAVSACKPANNSASSNSQSSASRAVRIISLSPAISRALVDFQLQENIVGRTPHCAMLDDSIPAVGDLLNINYEHVIRLNPTHILVQPPEAGVDGNLQQLAQQHGWKIVQWKLDSLDDIETMVREIPAALFADGTPEFASATQRSAELLNQIATALSPGDTPIYRGRTMLVYSVSPISVFGQGTYLDGVLTALGATNATTSRDWVTFSAEDFVRLNPQAVVLVRPGLESTSLVSSFGMLWEMDVEAMNERRIAILKHPEAFLPSTSVIGVAGELRAILEQFQAQRP